MKNKWYKSNLTKTLLLIAEHICAAVVIAAVLSVMAYPTFAEEMVTGRTSKNYEESIVFENAMKQYSSQAAMGIGAKPIFETDGKYNPDKIIDVEEYYNSSTVSEKNESGLSYRLGDLLDWDIYYDEYASKDDEIIVCKREDGTYYYYRYGEIEPLVSSGQLVVNGFEEYDGDLLDYISSVGDSGSDSFSLQVRDEKGKLQYKDCWVFAGSYVSEEYQPVDAQSILDVVNNNEHWNGRLSDAFDMIESVSVDLQDNLYCYSRGDDNITEGDTNFYYIYVDTSTKTVYSNHKAYSSYDDLKANVNRLKQLGKYVIVEPTLDGFESNISYADATAWRDVVTTHLNKENDFYYIAAVDTNYPIQDRFYTDNQNYQAYGVGARTLLVCGIVCAVLFVIGLIWLTVIAGRNSIDDELHLNRFDRWKTEIAAVLSLGIGIGIAVIGIIIISNSGVLYYDNDDSISYGMITACVAAVTAIEVVAFSVLLVGYLSLVRRIKAHTLWKDSICRKILKAIQFVFNHIHCVWKMLLIFGAFVIIHWFAMVFMYSSGSAIFFLGMVLVELAVAVGLVFYAVGREKIKTGIQRIAEGDVEYKIPTEKMLPEHKLIAEKVNAIGGGLDAAVEKSMKSERLKTDLITNVSHDIKTPLTSIINYVDLLKKEKFEDPKIQRYLEILDQKSQRLKILTEDVVEASKVSSGNISLEYMRINFVEMIQQTSGEFEEKFKARGLQEILTLPENEVVIRVDGRRTWRILENIYNNAAKYAMEGSRVYAGLTTEGGNAVFTLKNISEQPLNISADELTERFIRGDISRSTEGSGLGLSIAQNLTQMQGGKFEIYLDGDLFKVTVMFPMV